MNFNSAFQNASVHIYSYMLSYGSTNVEVIQDTLQVNLNSLVSAVGGSLGLFLGFSFYDFTLWLMNRFIVQN